MYNVYNFFKKYGVDFTNKKILDYGCDTGRLLRQYQTNLNNYMYTGFDVREEVILLNRMEFPNQNWIYQNIHNPAYNPNGSELLLLDSSYDLIVSFSVFTHTSYEEFDQCISHFYHHLNPNGEMFLTFLALNNDVVLNKLREKRINRYGSCDVFYDPNDYYYVTNNKIVSEFPDKCDLILTLYNNNTISQYGNIIYNEYQNILHIQKN